MNSRRLLQTAFVALTLVGLLLAGCGTPQVVYVVASPTPTRFVVTMVVTSIPPAATATPVPPIATATTVPPTAAPTPSVGRVEGALVSALVFTPPEGIGLIRPELPNETVLLCLKTTPSRCTIDRGLSVKSDDSGGFVFDSVPPGEYVVLYAAFLSQQDEANVDGFWAYWDGRELDFGDLDAFVASFVDPADAVAPQFVSDRGYGPLQEAGQQPGGWANTCVSYMAKFMAVEFVGDMAPLTVTVVPGQVVQVTVEAHAGIVLIMF